METGDSPGTNREAIRINLSQAIDIALSDNPVIKVADREIALKKESNREAYAGLFPDISATGGYSRTLKKQTVVMEFGGESQTIQMGIDNSYNGGFVVSLPVFAPALYKSIRLTQTDVTLAVEKSRASRLDMINQVTKAYYQLLLAQDGYEVLQQSFRQAEANFDVVNEMYRQGMVSEYDKIRSEVQVRSLKPNVVSAENGVKLAKLQLKVLMGLEKDAEIEVEGNLKDYETELFARETADRSLSLENNSELKQIDLNAEMLFLNRKLQETNFMPTVSASFNYIYTSLSNHFRIRDYNWFPYSTAGLTLTVPLFRASNFPKLRKTQIQIQQLEETRLNTERMLQMQIAGCLNSMSAGTEQIASNRESILQAEKGRLIAQKRYEVGKGTIIELNDSEVALTQARLVYNQSIYDYLTAKADLDKVLGSEERIK
ncbi:MAG: TolC family protein [Tannerella sp.]|nr:TolC family protein [Tannerella sp.]